MISVTLDSNIHISALNFGGEPLRLLKMAENVLIRLDVSDAIFEEFGGVLRDKFGWSDGDIAEAQEDIRGIANHVTPAEALTVVRADATNNRIVECAVAARSDYLVTGEKHLLQLKGYAGTRILKPVEFLECARGH